MFSKCRNIFLLLIVLSKAVHIAFAGTPLFPDIEILDSTENGITLIYRPLVQEFIEPGVSGELLLSIPFHTTDALPGGYLLPFRNHLIAIPPGANVSLNIQSLITTSAVNSQPLKAPVDSTQDAPAKGIDAIQDFITVSQPYRFRRQNVIRLTLNPAIFHQGSNSIDFAEEIRFSVNFSGGSPTGHSEANLQAFGDAFLNIEQAAQWAYPASQSSFYSFPAGAVFEIDVDSEGIYKIDYNDISFLMSGIDNYPLSHFKLYNNGGRELSTLISAPEIDSLVENAIYIFDDNNNDRFNPGDYILFYGRGTNGWEQGISGSFNHYINHYTYNNVYWLDLDGGAPGKRMTDFTSTGSAATEVITTRARIYREDEKVIFASSSVPGSGLNWYGDLISSGSAKTYIHSLSDISSQYYKIKVALHSVGGNSTAAVYWNNQNLGTVTAGISKTFTGENLSQDGINYLKFEHYSGASAYIDWYEIEYERYLESQQSVSELYIESPLGSGVAQYDSLYGLTAESYIFDITDFAEVGLYRGNSFKDDLSSSSARRYYACEPQAFRVPVAIDFYSPPPSDFADLRDLANTADYLYISHNDFYAGLDELIDLWTLKGINVKRIDVQQIYDQFSGGLYDPVSIRNFLRYAVDNWSVSPYMVGFIGDGDYDFMNRTSDNDKNWIPVYESGVYCYDDFFAYLHDLWEPELGLGRWTIQSEAEFDIVKDKVLKYAGEPDFGPWRMKFTLVADDEFGDYGIPSAWEQAHTEYSEDLDEIYIPDFFHTDKIYLTEYPLTAGAGGRQKLGATDDLIETINDGTVIVNYFGHGNESVWAHENAFNHSRDLPLLDNDYKLSYFIAMTCTWAYLDNPEKQSMPEDMLTLPGRGAIACIGASRSTGPLSNWNLAAWLYANVYEDPHNPKPMGQSLMNAKILYGGSNSEKYHIIGDPMVAPAAPKFGGEITSIQPDSLFALNLTTVTGNTLYNDSLWTNFTGTVYLQVLDAAIPTAYQFAGSDEIIVYDLPGNTIFRGPFSASGGIFNGHFIVPIDITYGGTLGRISVYYTDGDIDGCAFIDSMYIGSGGIELSDSDKPSAGIYFGDRSYTPGDPVPVSPVILADISDSSGVNLTGSPGHEILLIADENQEFDLTEFFEYETDSYMSGTLTHQLDYLAPGVHNMKLNVWDSFNNLSQFEFTVETADIDPDDDYLYDLLNYPNPFKESTAFTFKILESAEVKVDIYTVAGRKIMSLGPEYCLPTYVYDQFSWNGRDFSGDKIANGVYLYKVTAKFSGETISKVGRIIVMQ